MNVPPLPKGPLLGRDDLIADLAARLCAGRSPALSTAGMGGVGKTALAVVLAHHQGVREHFRDGVLWAGLGQQADVAAVQAGWASALGLDISGVADPESRIEIIGSAIGQRRVLIVLDDVWRPQDAELLRCSGQVAHLLTSRNEEIARAFAGVSQSVHVPSLTDDPSLALLRRLAPEACAANPSAVKNLVDATGGLPLALEILGGYLAVPERSLFPELSQRAFAELADPKARLALAAQRLGDRRDVKKTLDEILRLSLGDLQQVDPGAVTAFYALGAFAPKPARFDRAAGEAVTGAGAATIALLVARNLLEGEASGAAPDRGDWLLLHQTLADLAAPQTPADARVRHRDHYLGLVREDDGDWQRIERVYPQIAHGWRRQVAASDADPSLIAYTDALSTYQRHRGLWQDRTLWLERALDIAESRQDSWETARMLNNIGVVYSDLGEKGKALEYLEQALPLRRQVGDRGGEATALNNIGQIYSDMGEKGKALAHFEQALPIWRQVGDRGGEAKTLNNIGGVCDALGDKRKALAYYEQALPLQRQVGDRLGESVTRYNVAAACVELGNLEQAQAELEIVVALDEAYGLPDLVNDRAVLDDIRRRRLQGQ